jgi:alpha-tubulin suppressor-like RCC1 family protein
MSGMFLRLATNEGEYMFRYMIVLLMCLSGCRHFGSQSSLKANVSGPTFSIGDDFYKLSGQFLISGNCEMLNEAQSPCFADVKKVYYNAFQVLFSRMTVDRIGLTERLGIFQVIEGKRPLPFDETVEGSIKSVFDRLKVMPADGTIHVVAGDDRTVGISVNGEVYNWGRIGDYSYYSIVKIPQGLGSVYADMVLGMFDSQCFLKIDGEVFCSSKSITAISPPALGQMRFIKVFLGGKFACGLDEHRAAFCWGGKNEYGELGNGASGVGAEAQGVFKVIGNHKFKSLALGDIHACGLDLQGDVYCWGDNQSGQLGSGDRVSHVEPMKVQSNRKFSDIYAGTGLGNGSSICALDLAGHAYCWGSNSDGILGTPPTTGRICGSRDVPTLQMADITYSQIVISGKLNLGLGLNGKLFKWWCNSSCDLSCGPHPILDEFHFSRVSTGDRYACGIEYDVAYCWGKNDYGQIGNGKTTGATSPVPVKMPLQDFN